MTRSIERLLIANRGEIACRIARSCHDLGVHTVAVFTPADRGSLHALECDEALQVTDYLDIDALLAAAARAGAHGVHPGYGFLSENARFAQAVLDAGLLWVGPPPSAIASMGSKAQSRRLMAESGVPVVPGYDGDEQSDAALLAAAAQLGLPVMVKASAGGGGKGMQAVHDLAALPEALAQARRLALAAFGDDRLIIEKLLERPRHVEVQVLADAHGTCLHLFERECSVQRRHQKVIEESPSPAFVGFAGEARRATMWEDAVRAARAVGYENAGTVEFMVDATGRHHFLEMNTRLQVEHPVTEMVTGLDLVALQLRVAEGRPLGLAQADIRRQGWSIEARLYAEDPDRAWLPSPGRLLSWRAPAGPGVRVDSGVGAGSIVGTSYDPLLAKVVAHGPDRDTARLRLARALDDLDVLGVSTNRAWLAAVLRHPAFAAGDLHTGFLDEHGADLRQTTGHSAEPAAVAAVALTWARRKAERTILPGLRGGWRQVPWPAPPVRLELGGLPAELSYREVGEGIEVCSNRWRPGEAIPGLEEHGGAGDLVPEPVLVRLLPPRSGRVEIEVGGHLRSWSVAFTADGVWLGDAEGARFVRVLADLPPPGHRADEAGSSAAPMPGKVVAVLVATGETVEPGQPLVMLEAMKMEHTVVAPGRGLVRAVLVQPGEQVAAGQPLIDLADAERD